MRFWLISTALLINGSLYAQNDTAKTVADTIRLNEAAQNPDKKTARVTVQSGTGWKQRGNSWEDRWLTHVEKQSLVIAGKLLKTDSTKRLYKAFIEFTINEDGTLRDLKVTCTPANTVVQRECEKIARTMPAHKPQYRNGKYVRPRIYQPVEIKVNY